MRTGKTLMLGLMAFCAIAFSSCKKEKPAEEIEGSYKGTIVMSVSGTEQGSVDTTIVLTAVNEEQVKILIPAMGEGRMSVPDITINNVNVSEASDNLYNLAETAVEFTNNDITWKGSIKGNVNNNVLNLEYTLQPGAMPMSIDFVFTSK